MAMNVGAAPAPRGLRVPTGKWRPRLRGGLHQARLWARNSAWLLPVVGALVGAGLAVLFVAPSLGARHALLRGWAWRATVPEARNVLATVLGTVLTTLSIALSLSLVVLQNSASQYSPRLLRLFLKEPGARVLIPTFVCTGVYCLVAVNGFGFVKDQGAEPRPALSLALLLLVCCGAALVFQMTYTLRMVRAEQIVRRVRRASVGVARELAHQRSRDTEPAPMAPEPSATGRPIRAPSSGFVVDIDARELLALAESHGLVIHVDVLIGEPVVRGTQLGRVRLEGGASREEERVAEVERTVLIGPWRETDRDLALGVRQLVDVALKALSPGVNDPTTAVETLDQLTLLMCELCRLRQGPRVLAGTDERPRVFLRALELRDYLVLATEQISRYGAGEPAVVLRLLRLAGEVGLRVTREEDMRATREVLHQVRADAEAALGGTSRLPPLRRYAEDVERALEREERLPALPSLGF